MKKLLLILIFAFSFNLNAQLIEVQIDSISDTRDIVREGRDEVYIDSVLQNTRTVYSKATIDLFRLSNTIDKSRLRIKSPDSYITGSVKYFIDKSKLQLEPCTNNAVETIKTSDNTVIVELPSDDTGYYYVINPDNKILVALGKTYTNTQFLTFVQYQTSISHLLQPEK